MGAGFGGCVDKFLSSFCGQVRSRSWLSGYILSFILWPHFPRFVAYDSYTAVVSAVYDSYTAVVSAVYDSYTAVVSAAADDRTNE